MVVFISSLFVFLETEANSFWSDWTSLWLNLQIKRRTEQCHFVQAQIRPLITIFNLNTFDTNTGAENPYQQQQQQIRTNLFSGTNLITFAISLFLGCLPGAVPGIPVVNSLKGQQKCQARKQVWCLTRLFFSVPSAVESWCRCATTQRRAACWSGSYAAPIWQPWTPTATLTPLSKCKSCLMQSI